MPRLYSRYDCCVIENDLYLSIAFRSAEGFQPQPCSQIANPSSIFEVPSRVPGPNLGVAFARSLPTLLFPYICGKGAATPSNSNREGSRVITASSRQPWSRSGE